jgi:m7GpppX diphosphatase
VNILEGKSEQKNILFNDSNSKKGFILVKGLEFFQKKDSEAKNSFHMIALVNDNSIKSLREINSSHIELL